MMNQQTVKDLLTTLPLLDGKIAKEHMDILVYKWGKIDGLYHSPKAVIGYYKLNISEDGIRKIEQDAVSSIENEVVLLFTHKECGVDVRKCGLSKMQLGYELSKVYLATDGRQSRKTDIVFKKQSFSAVPKSIVYECLNCGNQIKDNSAMWMFLSNGITRDSIAAYIKNHSVRGRAQTERELKLATNAADRQAGGEINEQLIVGMAQEFMRMGHRNGERIE